MTISKELRATSILKGNGVSTEFPFTFKVFNAQTDIAVFRSDSVDSLSEEQVSRDAYAVTLNADQENNPGGVVVFSVAPKSGTVFVIQSSIPILQGTSLTNYDRFLPNVLNDIHDKLTALIQQLAYVMGRCLVVPSISEKTPQQVLTEVLEIAATANSYAQQAQQIYATVEGDVAELKALKTEIEGLVVTFQTIEQLAAQAQANAHSTNDDKLTCQQALQQIQAIATQTGFSTRTSPTVSASETFPLSNLTPSAYVKVGDLVLNSTNGDLFRITEVTATTVTVGAKISNLRGPAGERGLQGSPGPAGERGEAGPMGQSPYATCFGQFQVNGEGMLQLEYVGLAPAEFSINDNGEVVATYANT